MTPPVTIVVRGRPAPQGSKRAFAGKRKDGTTYAGVIESSHDRVKSWRAAVIDACDDQAPAPTLHGPLDVTMLFWLPRPRSHHRAGRNCHLLRPGPPRLPGAAPDIEKLARATSDALTDAAVWRDDGQVTDCHLSKRYADGDQVPGALITIRSAI